MGLNRSFLYNTNNYNNNKKMHLESTLITTHLLRIVNLVFFGRFLFVTFIHEKKISRRSFIIQ